MQRFCMGIERDPQMAVVVNGWPPQLAPDLAFLRRDPWHLCIVVKATSHVAGPFAFFTWASERGRWRKLEDGAAGCRIDGAGNSVV